MHSRWFDLLAALGGAALVADARTLRVTWVSEELITLSGCDHDRWLADPPLLPELVHPADRERVFTAFREASAETRLQPLPPLLDRALQAAQRLVPPPTPPGTIDIVITLAARLPRVPVDEQLLPMALVNVLANALQAMPRGGRLAVDVRLTTDAEQRWLSIAVSDSGPGIPPEVVGRIFEPFVTTRATGTGLGLALTKRVLDGHGGVIDVRSAPGQGATFTLRLPLTTEPA
ncbi:MAG: ATP-binding protein [Minicystis sp.]